MGVRSAERPATGLSRRQRQILGLAVALARRRRRSRKLFGADLADAPDITVAFAASAIGGVALIRSRQDRSPGALSVRGSIDRAFVSLAQRGLLVPCKPIIGSRNRGRYRLTAAGITVAPDVAITAAMRPALWLLERR